MNMKCGVYNNCGCNMDIMCLYYIHDNGKHCNA